MQLTKQQFITILNIIKDLMDEQDKTAKVIIRHGKMKG